MIVAHEFENDFICFDPIFSWRKAEERYSIYHKDLAYFTCVLCHLGELNLSDTDFYSLSDEEAAAPPVYSVVKKKNQAKTAEQKYLYIEVILTITAARKAS